MSDSTLKSTSRWLLAAIFLLALGLRLWGNNWGLPGRTEMHPDEHDYVMKHALLLSRQNLDPGWYNYPAFLMYLTAGASGILRHLGCAMLDWQCYLVGRIIVAIFGAATSLVMFGLARALGGSARAGLLAALWMALLPLNVWECHMAITDPVMTFWTALTVLLSVRLIDRTRLIDFALAGAALGLAVGSKYTAAIAVVAIFAGTVASRSVWLRKFAGLVIAGVTSLVFAFIATPYSFIHFDKLRTAMQYEHNHTIGHHSGFSLPADGWQYHRYLYQIVAAWPFSLGIALYACAAAGALWALFHFDRRKFVPIAFAAAFFAVTGSWTFTPIRYYLPIIVLGTVLAGLWQADWIESGKGPRRAIAVIATLACLIYTGIFTMQTTARFGRETRDVAGRWLDENLKTNQTMLACGWARYLALPSRCAPSMVIDGKNDAAVRSLKGNETNDLIQVSSLHFDRFYRAGDQGWINSYNHLRKPAGPFELVAKFDSHFINKKFYRKLDPMFGGYFVSPTLEFYRAKSKGAKSDAGGAQSPGK